MRGVGKQNESAGGCFQERDIRRSVVQIGCHLGNTGETQNEIGVFVFYCSESFGKF